MINRSGFLRSSLALAGASLFALFTACGGKIDGSTTSSDGGIQGGDSGGCTGAFSCPVCEGDSNPPAAQCIDGEWSCPVTKCEPPPLGCEDSLPPPCGSCSAVCNDNVWECPTDCSDTCPSDISGLAGTACSVEGLICGGEDCTNPCDFCNFIGCQSGVWTNEEAPPEPCPIDGGAFDGG